MLEAKKGPEDRIIHVQRMENALEIRTERGYLRIEPKRSDIFRIRYAHVPLSSRTGDGILSHPDCSCWRYDDLADEINLTTENASLHISKRNSAIRYTSAAGKLLLTECSRALEKFDAPLPDAGSTETVWDVVQTPDGTKRVPKKQAGGVQQFYHTWLHLSFQKDEHLYGLGQAEEGKLNLRGTTQYLHQANRKIAIPMLLSSLGWGILWATDSSAIFQDTQYGSYFFTHADAEQDYYFIAGYHLDGVVSGYRFLTGKAAMLPRWAMGYMQSQERYETQEELLAVAQGYRDRHIGLDCIVLDWNSWREGEWGQKSFDPVHFGNMTEIIDRLHALGVHFMLSIWPNMSENTKDYQAFHLQHLLLPGSDIYDAFDPQARKLYWKQAEASLFCHGIDAWWCDSCEPFTPEWTHTQKPDPAYMYHEYIETASQSIPAHRINAYSLHHAQTVFEGQRASGSPKRVVNLSRSAHTGQQRYGVILWSGDIEASWDTYRRQIAAGLNFCASGFPYWTLDIGGFFVKQGCQWFWQGHYEKGMLDPRYCELFVRWHQFGAFLPIFRGHGTDIRRELWALDGKDHRFYEAACTVNRLRYTLLPYLYSLSGNAWLRDGTIMRMLAFDFPEDTHALDIDDQYMLGPAIMVCPVTQPMYFDENGQAVEKPTETRTVYLPSGTQWYDWYTGTKYTGGQIIQADAKLEQIPLFVRAGSIIPVCEGLESCEFLPSDQIDLRVYSGTDGTFDLYEDAGDGYEYERGEYSVTHIRWNEAAQKLEIHRPSRRAAWFARQWHPKVYLLS